MEGLLSMVPHVSLITLGVDDLPRARLFYQQLGFQVSAASRPTVVFMQAGAVALSLFSRASLAEDANVPDDKPGFSGITLACNVASDADVDALIARAVACGGTLKKPGQKVFWGGYSGYFADPDGHLWEVAHNPFIPLAPDGRLTLP